MQSKKLRCNLKKIKLYLICNKKELAYSFLIALVFFGSFFRMNYTTDTYADIMDNYGSISKNFLGAGRFFAYALYLLYKIGLSINLIYGISFALAIISTAISIFILGKYLQKVYIKQKGGWLPYLLSTILVINPFTIELFFYLEKGVMISAILFAILGAIAFHKYTIRRHKHILITSFIFAFLSCCSYQGVIGLYVTLSVVFIILDKIKYKQAIKDFALCIILYLSAIAFNLLLSKIVNGTTKSGMMDFDFLATLFALMHGAKGMFALYNIIPSIIVYLLVVLVCTSYIYNAKTSQLKHSVFFLGGLILLALIIGTAVLPYLSQSPSNIWFVPRSSWPYAAGIAIILIYISSQRNVKEKTLNITKLSCCVVLLLEFFNFSQIIIEHYQVNAMDELALKQIGEQVAEFEKNNNTTITNVAIINDKNISYTYPQKRIIGDVQVMAMATDWSNVNALNYYTGRNMVAIRVDDSDDSLCSDNNNLSLDISFIEDDTVLICKH